ncbi:MAG: flavin-containing monooxygenase [Jatrophihabitans sp.]
MKIVVVGAGFGGIAAAIELRKHGMDDVTLLEAASELGGTWHHNRYPGAACDVPSHLYSYSFAQHAQWSRFCSPQSEILAYLREVADEHDITRRVVLGTEVTACHWDDATHRWTVHTETVDGRPVEYDADAVVLAVGQLNKPAFPRIDGIESFGGTSFHSARWDLDYDLRGKRVGVIGTGASAVQFVPAIAEDVAHLAVFQRTGNWFLPRKNNDYAPFVSASFRRIPALRRLWRTALFHYLESLTAMIRHPKTVGRIGWLWSVLFMRLQLRDRDARRAVWPHYRFGCKRVLFSSAWLPTLQRSNVEVVTEPIVEMTPTGPRTKDGRVHEVDCIVYGTGFKTTDFMLPMRVTGAGGLVLDEVWTAGAHAHLGISIPGFPSLFVMYGPNTNTSGGSIIHFLESQAGYIRRALQLAQRHGAAAIDIRPEVEQRSDREVQASFAGTAWLECNSWYRDDTGRIVTNWPGYMSEYARLTEQIDPADYVFVERLAGDTTRS